jgi:glycosyltransferase involved in cell wall biosynthesis
MYPENPGDIWAVCNGQEDHKCASRCYARYFSGAPEESEKEIAYWADWVQRRMAHIREICDAVDLFIAPSRYLLRRFCDEFGLPDHKLVYLDYGFHHKRLQNRHRSTGEPFTFGYIGTHIPAKGVNHLIQAFGQLSGDVRLRVWGRHRHGPTESLEALVDTLPGDACKRIEWMSEYRNQDIVSEVFNRCDAIVVPSIWAENSPLVIHEALQARVPVITADYGGMAEYIHHEVNGLCFMHRNPTALAEQMQRFANDPDFARRLGARGYFQSPDGNVPDMSRHTYIIEDLYARVLLLEKGGYERDRYYSDATRSLAHHL